MQNVIASASDGSTRNIGIRNSAVSSPVMINVTALAQGGASAFGVKNESASPTMTNVSASAADGTSENMGVSNTAASSPVMTGGAASAAGGSAAYGVFSDGNSAPWMTGVKVSASGTNNSYGLFFSGATGVIQNSEIKAFGATTNLGVYINFTSGLIPFTVKINNCQVTGSTHTIDNADSNTTVRIGASLLDGGNVVNLGSLTCAGMYDENYIFYPSTCP